jgi:hypothetical protein
VTAAIEGAERAGVIECRHGVGQRPNVYTLTWLPLMGRKGQGGKAPSERWRDYRPEMSVKKHSQRRRYASSECQSTLKTECQSALIGGVASAEQHSLKNTNGGNPPSLMSVKQHSPSRVLYQGGDVSLREDLRED